MLAVIQSVDRDRRMVRVGDANAHGVDGGIGNQRFRGFVYLAAEVRSHCLRALAGDIEHTEYCRVRVVLIFRRMALSCDRAAADDAYI